MNAKTRSRLLAALALTPAAVVAARAESYLTESQAADALFPGVALKPTWTELSPEQVRAVERGSGERVLSPRVRALWAPDGGAMIVDRVVGKHEFITYAVALSSDAAVLGVEIMDYRETFGAEVREAGWRKQFAGKTSRDALRAGKDIRAISGATLSSVHVAAGVRRTIRTYEALRPRDARP